MDLWDETRNVNDVTEQLRERGKRNLCLAIWCKKQQQRLDIIEHNFIIKLKNWKQ